jgi:hypothetical protein
VGQAVVCACANGAARPTSVNAATRRVTGFNDVS